MVLSIWSDFWDTFTSGLTLPFDGLLKLVDIFHGLGSLFSNFIDFIPYPLNSILLAFLPLLVLALVFRVVRS